MEYSHIVATTIPQDVEKAALNSIAVDVGVTQRSAAADKLVRADEAVDKPKSFTTSSGTDDVRVLTLAEYKDAAYALAEAFWKDETCMYMIHTPDRASWSEQQKWELHLKIMEYITYAHLLKGLVVSAGPNYDCVGLWMPPGENMDDYLTILRSGMWRLSYQLSAEGRKRFFSEFLPLLNDTKAQVLGPRDDDSWYLVYIGTRPGSRGRGYARKVIRHVSREADREGKACYLESSHEVNRIIYGKLGFRMIKAVYLQRDVESVRMDIMIREPGAKAIMYASTKEERKESDADSGVDVQ